MKRIVAFTGAGVSAESGVATFRDTGDGLWYNYKIDEVATKEGWKKDKEKVLEFHNMLRKLLPDAEPNAAHKALVDLEKDYDVTIITQNVDDLHERAGSKNVLHLHGELTKARSCYAHEMEQNPKLYDVGYGDINIGDKCDDHGSQLRPHTVLFGEYPYNVPESYEALVGADYLLIIGTSLPITYTHEMLKSVNPKAKIFYIDPTPNKILGMEMDYFDEVATTGLAKVIEEIYGFEKV